MRQRIFVSDARACGAGRQPASQNQRRLVKKGVFSVAYETASRQFQSSLTGAVNPIGGEITRPSKGAFRMRSEMRGGCGARARSRKPLPGGSGHHVRRHYDRCAGCCRWTGTGRGGVTPAWTASQETWPGVEKPRGRTFGQSRGGAPRGERAAISARRARRAFRWQHRDAWRGSEIVAPTGAPPPFICFEAKFLVPSVISIALARVAPRERDALLTLPAVRSLLMLAGLVDWKTYRGKRWQTS
jgi:hypothetical protein